jgi:hypothetical protein
VIALLSAEAPAVAGRDWRLEERGGPDPRPIPTIYYMTPEILKLVVPAWDDNDLEALGREGQKAFFTALAVSHVLASHSGAVLGDPYRRKAPSSWTGQPSDLGGDNGSGGAADRAPADHRDHRPWCTGRADPTFVV